MFERFISIDWSGAATEHERVDIRVVQGTSEHGGQVVSPPHTRKGTKSWTRAECRKWLAEVLEQDRSRCLIVMDFGFGFPWGADRAAFRCQGWREMIGAVAEVYGEQSYREQRWAEFTAEEINSRIAGPGPYRFGQDRANFRFYLDYEIAYYRLVEVVVPQAMSQWYFPKGPRVASSTITGMAALDCLMRIREQEKIDFQVWPQEDLVPNAGKHILVESYPAIYPELPDYGPCTDENCQDAWRVLQWMLTKADAGTLESTFEIAPKPFGRVKGISFEDQVRFEGWILGVL